MRLLLLKGRQLTAAGAATFHRTLKRDLGQGGAAPQAKPKPRPLLFAQPPAPAGQHELGKTKSGKPVFASGAESTKYSDDEHREAAELHARAHLHHSTRAAAHGEQAGGDPDWKRSESTAGDAGRHRKLADHHFDLVRDHMMAAGRSGDANLEPHKDGMRLSAMTPHGKDERAAAKERLAQRTHHSHPGGVDDRDSGAYAKFATGAR